MKKVLLLANRDFVLYNFRFELIERLIKDHYDVYICLPYGPKVDTMKKAGAKFIPIEVEGRGTNPLKDLRLIERLNRIFKEISPDVILMYTTKTDIYGGIVAAHRKLPYIQNISGLGTAVEQKSKIEGLVISLYRKAVKKASCVFFQNKGNEEFFKEHNIPVKKARLIPGSGVNLVRWKYLPYPSDESGIHFLFIARVIKEKGIEQYLRTAKVIKKQYPNTFFHILGPCDGDYKDVLDKYQENGIIEYHGMVQDTAEYLATAHCTIHPSFYPEGISNVLLESAASGRPVITTDREGCRDTVNDGESGYIVPQLDTGKLIEAVEKFLSLNNKEREKMGVAGRKKMEQEFDRQIVVDAYMEEVKNIL